MTQAPESSLQGKILPTHLAELRAADDQIDQSAKAKVGLHHLLNQRLVGELQAAAKGLAEEFAAELAGEVIAALREKVVAQVIESIDGGAIGQNSFRIRFTSAADGVEAFQSEAQGSDALVAAHAVLIAAMSLNELAFGEVGGSFFGRRRQFFAEDDLGEPGAAQDGAVARGSGLFGERGGEPEDAAATLGTNLIHSMPV